MIVVLVGENSYEVSRALHALESQFSGTPERVDGLDVELRQLPDILMGATLFSDKRLVIIRDLSQNKAAWNDLERWIEKASSDVDVVLVESKLDKRTKTYKTLKKVASLREFAAWTDRDEGRAIEWLAQEAANRSVVVDKKCIQVIVERVGVDQWRLLSALDKLSALEVIDESAVREHIAASPVENVFNLFESALRAKPDVVHEMIRTLERTDDPYMVFGLLSGQAFQLVALGASEGRPVADVAKDIGAHPYALGKLVPYASRLSRAQRTRLIDAFAQSDLEMKTTSADPWLLVERALLKTAAL